MSALDLINSLINKVDAAINNNMEEKKEEVKQDQSPKMGGAKDVEIDEMVKAAAEAVRQQVIEKANFAQIKEYEVVKAKGQVVAGMNYCIKIKTDKDAYTHVCVYAKLDKSYELQGICFDKKLNDPLDFSCKENNAAMDRKQIANSFIGKKFYKDDDSGNDPNGVYKNDVNAICSRYRAVYPPAAMTMDFDANRLNIFMEKDTDKIVKVTWG